MLLRVQQTHTKISSGFLIMLLSASAGTSGQNSKKVFVKGK